MRSRKAVRCPMDRKRRREAGLCWDCPSPVSNGCVRCSECLERRRLSSRERYAERKRAQLCNKCNQPTGGPSRCRPCEIADQRSRNRTPALHATKGPEVVYEVRCDHCRLGGHTAEQCDLRPANYVRRDSPMGKALW